MVSVMQLLFYAVRTFVQVAFLASFVFGIALVQPLDLCFSGASSIMARIPATSVVGGFAHSLPFD